MLEKLQSFSDGKYDLERKDIENIYLEQRLDVAEQMEELGITKRGVTTAKLLQTARQTSGSTTTSGLGRAGSSASKAGMGGIDRKSSQSSYAPKQVETPATYTSASRLTAPPPYTSTPSSGSISKEAPPLPPPLKPKPSYNKVKYATAIFDFEAQASPNPLIALRTLVNHVVWVCV